MIESALNGCRRLLRSAKLALATLGFIAAYSGAFAWAPWQRSLEIAAPGWAQTLFLDRPFSSPLFVAAIVLLFLETLVCTLDRTTLTAAQWTGAAASRGFALPRREGSSMADFLRVRGFAVGPNGAMFRYRFAVWGGWILHVGLLALILGVAIQRTFHDGGAFELAIGETANLRREGVVFARDHGWLAPAKPPDIEVALLDFDPFLHQSGYAPDRASRMSAAQSGQSAKEILIDRARGARIGSTSIYQAIPTGLAVTIDAEGLGIRSIHLREFVPRIATAEVTDPAGRNVKFVLTSERPLGSRMGTGPVALRVEGDGFKKVVTAGESFPFGSGRARLSAVSRWAGFTYSRSPGMPLVMLSFGMILLGCVLLVFPVGTALIACDESDVAAWIWVKRGGDILRNEWEQTGTDEAGRCEVV